MLGKPRADLRRVLLQSLDALRHLPIGIWLGLRAIRRAMPLQHRGRGQLQLGGLALEIRPRATAMLRRIARELHAVNRKHLAADQALCVTHGQDGREHARDVRTERAHELGDGREVRGTVSAEGDERHVLLTRPLDLPAAHDPLRVREQHHLEQQRGRIGRGARRIILKPRVEVRQVDRVLEQMIQRVLERAGQQLPRQVNGQQSGLRIDVLVARHADTSTRRTLGCRFPAANTRGTGRSSVSTSTVRGLFLQPR